MSLQGAGERKAAPNQPAHGRPPLDGEQVERVYHFDNCFREEAAFFGGIRLYQIGETCLEKGCLWPPHRQWCYEISYIVSGEGTFGTNDRLYPVRPNDVYLNGRSETHTILADRGSRLRYLFLGFDIPETSDCASDYADILRFFDTIDTPCRADVCGVGELLRRLTQEFYWKQPCFEEIVAASLRLLILRVYRNGLGGTEPSGFAPDASRPYGAVIYTVCRCIDDQIDSLTSVGDIAQRLGYSTSYLSHVFREKTGETLQACLRRKKMERAVFLMRNAGYSPSQAAERLGYQSLQAFSKAFRSVYGCSPTSYLRPPV